MAIILSRGNESTYMSAVGQAVAEFQSDVCLTIFRNHKNIPIVYLIEAEWRIYASVN